MDVSTKQVKWRNDLEFLDTEFLEPSFDNNNGATRISRDDPGRFVVEPTDTSVRNVGHLALAFAVTRSSPNVSTGTETRYGP